MPSVVFLNSENRTVSDSPSDAWYCPYVTPDTRPRLAFFPPVDTSAPDATEAPAEVTGAKVPERVDDTESVSEDEAPIDPDTVMYFPHIPNLSMEGQKRVRKQTVFYKA
jgi:hypothetical protein